MSDHRIRVMIVDDEPLARERIRTLLRNDPEIEIVCESTNGNEAAVLLMRHYPDLLYLDIQMPGMDGFGVLRKMNSHIMPLVIFVTAYDEYAMKAFEFHACDYLLKPFKKKRFAESLQWAKSALKNRNDSGWTRQTLKLIEALQDRPLYLDRIPIKEHGRVIFVRVKDVDWIKAEDNYIRIHSGDASYLIRQPIGALEKELDPKCFARVHRSAIVNVERIKELQQWFRRDYRVVLQNGIVLPLGRSYRQNLRSVLGVGGTL